jgi:ABC-type branched-chain amino acid transport systems, periplasmic component
VCRERARLRTQPQSRRRDRHARLRLRAPELPVLGAAKLLLVSPLNTATDLTHTYRGKIARLSAPDSAQAAVAARFLRNRGVTTVAAVSDGTKRGDDQRKEFVAAARRLGLPNRRAGDSRRRVRRRHSLPRHARGGRGRAPARSAGPTRPRSRLRACRPACGRRRSLPPRAPISSSLVSRSTARRVRARLRQAFRDRDRHVAASVRRLRGAGARLVLDSIARSSGTRAPSVGESCRRKCRTG